ncbi:MAG: AMP-binding protein [Muribaculaceae bacterium]|nr:AMP-binding protein [Muribaculaceae bacterium]
MADGRFVLTPAAREFLERWHDGADTVTAHTSGSTGAPKEIHLLKSDMLASARATVEFFGLTPSSHLVLPLSPGYIAGMMQIVRAEVAGCRLTVEEPSSCPLAGWCEGGSGRVSLLPVVPAQVEGLLRSGVTGMVDNLIVGGAPLASALEERIVSSGCRAYATYGMTETCSHVALRRLGCGEFTALPGFTFATDAEGCLAIESRTLSFGRLLTTDVVELTSATSFRWLGRADNVINSGGVKIHPEEVERVMAPLLPPGAMAYVGSRPSARWGSEAVIVTDSDAVTDALIDRLRPLLPRHHCPKGVVRVDRIRLTPTNKIIRERIE